MHALHLSITTAFLFVLAGVTTKTCPFWSVFGSSPWIVFTGLPKLKFDVILSNQFCLISFFPCPKQISCLLVSDYMSLLTVYSKNVVCIAGCREGHCSALNSWGDVCSQLGVQFCVVSQQVELLTCVVARSLDFRIWEHVLLHKRFESDGVFDYFLRHASFMKALHNNLVVDILSWMSIHLQTWLMSWFIV